MPDPNRITEDVALRLHCAYCHGPVTLQVSDWPSILQADGSKVTDPAAAVPDAFWACPYCQRENTGGFPGRLAWVRKRDA